MLEEFEVVFVSLTVKGLLFIYKFTQVLKELLYTIKCDIIMIINNIISHLYDLTNI
jgi:hypothetical protein